MSQHIQAIDLSVKLVSQWIPNRQSRSYKGNYGRLLLLGGNQQMGGAIQMSANAAINAGAGLTTVATAPINFPALHANRPEAMVLDRYDYQALTDQMAKNEIILVGPGLGRDTQDWQEIYQALMSIDQRKLVILDGDGITLLADQPASIYDLAKHHTLVLTPHPGEWSRLSQGKIPLTDNQAICQWANNHRLYLILKSEASRIFLPQGDYYYQNTAGNPGMATGGMGDTLAGMVAGLAGQIQPLEQALALATYLHSYIGDQLYQDHYVVLPTMIADQISYYLKQFEQDNK
ncbi:hypothetical protein AWM75_00380 [Aerococcus urinaehominis]|uniref:ADP-dependent (S)-NAD(P)H-hydrate dehydratase n=1 Tax=Aerococcus urinaehominis TaxID=128944 RepID=A0A0X8FK19_9LACT|nr:NAD(P)H-hydrate dehydratase [Aerococcus urinaehominis]AMB98539.1 hypothetical protein AWM75_00380 [Aerococcus urinaehominis]SDL78885.1 yjeF C-terminal region, hydroxyethylthiazole kinase-related [Aerococcus urinaehominis]